MDCTALQLTTQARFPDQGSPENVAEFATSISYLYRFLVLIRPASKSLRSGPSDQCIGANF